MNLKATHQPISFKELSDGTVFLRTTQWIPKGIHEVFGFFSQPENLEKLTPPQVGFRMLNTTPVEMAEGLELNYALRVKGIPLKWTSLITLWNPPYEFADCQIRGPYASWEHTHRFSREGSGTQVTDEVFYKAPGPRWVEKRLIRKDIERIFRHRQKTLEELYSSPSDLHR